MPLNDHFRPPLSVRRHWHAFHNAWATYLSSDLNQRLPEGYFAEPNVQFGIEIDVATFEEWRKGGAQAEGTCDPPGTAYAPSAPAITLPFPLDTDVVEVLLYETQAGPVLAGAIELVSPSNKDRPEHREAFVSKCETYLQQGVGVVVVDVVTHLSANLHVELLARLGHGQEPGWEAPLYAAAYRPVNGGSEPELEIWQEPLGVGERLPTVPLWLRGGPCLPVELELTYDRTCREQRIAASMA